MGRPCPWGFTRGYLGLLLGRFLLSAITPSLFPFSSAAAPQALSQRVLPHPPDHPPELPAPNSSPRAPRPRQSPPRNPAPLPSIPPRSRSPRSLLPTVPHRPPTARPTPNHFLAARNNRPSAGSASRKFPLPPARCASLARAPGSSVGRRSIPYPYQQSSAASTETPRPHALPLAPRSAFHSVLRLALMPALAPAHSCAPSASPPSSPSP